jgi:phage N-6-adenine-methyltransferase
MAQVDGSAKQIADYHKSIRDQERRQMPKQKPGNSRQDFATPDIFIAAVKKRFGIKDFAYDLAASATNTKARFYFDEKINSLLRAWHRLEGDLWLNPPYARIAPWAEKCWVSTTLSPALVKQRIFFLVPAAVGSNWFAKFVDGRALVLLLNGRLSFDGIANYPKDNILAVYGAKPSYEVWRWRK